MSFGGSLRGSTGGSKEFKSIGDGSSPIVPTNPRSSEAFSPVNSAFGQAPFGRRNLARIESSSGFQQGHSNVSVFQQEIPHFSERKRMDALSRLIGIVYSRRERSNISDTEWHDQTSAVADRIGEIPGITVVERRDFISDKNPETKYICTTYVFGTVYGEKWDPEDYRLIPGVRYRLRNDTDTFLAERGYERVKGELQLNDIIAYQVREQSTGTIETMHVGIYRGNNIVRSKPGGFHIVDHPMEMVPNMFGHVVVAYRRVSPQKQ